MAKEYNEFESGKGERSEEKLEIEFKDYIALFIAALQTIFVPLLLMIGVLLAFGIIFGMLF